MEVQTLQIAVVVGSIRRASINARLATALTSLAPAGMKLVPTAIGDLPLYNQDHESEPGEPVQRLRAAIAAANGVLFVTPEYNRSIPASLKNALDHGSRPYGKSVWAGKPAGLMGASPGASGTAMAQQHLRNVLAFLDMPTLGQPEVFLQADAGFYAEDGSLARPSTREFLTGWLAKFEAWVRLHGAPETAA